MLNIKNIVNIDTEAPTVIYNHGSMLWNSRHMVKAPQVGKIVIW